MQDVIIQIDNLSKEFSSSNGESLIYGLKNVDLAIPRGCIYGIIGPSGAGKSTLLRCLTGLEKPSGGMCLFDGEIFPHNDKKALEKLRKHMGMVFQHFQLFSSRSVANNIAYPLEITGVPLSERQARVEELLALVGLQSKGHYYPSQLSGGEKQRVGIARALATKPRLLFCDEPTSALDAKTTRDLLSLIKQLNEKLKVTMVLITHQLETVKQICQRVAVLSQGQIVEEGEVKDVFTKPQHTVTQHLLHMGLDQIPHDLLGKNRDGKRLVRLRFEGHKTTQPVISQMIKRFQVEANILCGGLDYIQETIAGHLFIELIGESEEIERSLEFLTYQHIDCKVFT